VKLDIVDEFRKWDLNHNTDNYGRFDAFKAGHELAKRNMVYETLTKEERKKISDGFSFVIHQYQIDAQAKHIVDLVLDAIDEKMRAKA